MADNDETVPRCVYEGACRVLALRAEELAELRAENAELQQLADQPRCDETIMRANAALNERLMQKHEEIERLRAALDEVQQARIDAAVEGSGYKAKWNACRRLLREATASCNVYTPCDPEDQTRIALVTLEWYEAARAAGGGE